MLAIVIVNFRTAAMTLDCIRSLASQVEELGDFRVIVVDNGSADGSAQFIQEEANRECWNWIKVVPLPVNVGFAAGNNRGLGHVANCEYVLLLNSDTLVHDGCLLHCLVAMRANPKIGAMSCLLLDSDGSPQVTARRFSPPGRQILCALGLPWRLPRLFGWADPQDAWDRKTTRRDVDWIGGAFMFCRADLLQKLKGFDEDFFFYGEDYHLCHRIHRVGYRIVYDPGVSITHLGGGSSDARLLAKPEKSRHEWRGRYLVYRKCYGRIAEWCLRVLDAVNYTTVAVCDAVRGRRSQWKPVRP